ncbi:unnamed protein product, partial [Discosporangium mesarthrocarpum]
MKTLLTTRFIDIPTNINVEVASRTVKVEGKRGTLVRSFKHLHIDIQRVGTKKLRVDLWFGNRKQMACIRTVCSHILNMFTGV